MEVKEITYIYKVRKCQIQSSQIDIQATLNPRLESLLDPNVIRIPPDHQTMYKVVVVVFVLF